MRTQIAEEFNQFLYQVLFRAPTRLPSADMRTLSSHARSEVPLCALVDRKEGLPKFAK